MLGMAPWAGLYLLPRRCGGTLVLQSHRARSISSHFPCRAAKAESDKSSTWKGKGRGLGQSFLLLNNHLCTVLPALVTVRILIFITEL